MIPGDLIPLERAHVSALADADPALAPLFAVVGDLNFRHRTGGFEGLLRLIVEQQLSVKAADAIWQKLRGGIAGEGGDVLPTRLLALSDEALRGHGLSRPKAKYARILAEAVHDRALDFDAVKTFDPEDAISHLTALKGIGRWTAEVYLMFCEGRLDIFPTGDIALREAMGWLDSLESRPDEAWCRTRSEIWSPYRSVVAHALWSWYGAVKRGELGRSFTV